MPRPLALLLAVAGVLAWWWGALAFDLPVLVRGPADQLTMPGHELRLLGLAAGPGVLLALGLWTAWPRARQAPTVGPLVLYGLGLAALAAVRLGVLRGAPLTDDEWAYAFQARTFASGALTVAAPPEGPWLDYLFLAVRDGRWFCHLQPGLALLMTPGVWLTGDGFWSLWPLHAALLPAVGALAGRLGGPKAAAVAPWVLLASPWFLLTGATVEPYAPLALVVTLWALGVVDLWRAPRALRGAALLGALLGVALLLRGFEFGLLGLATLAVWIARAARDRQVGWALGHGLVFLAGLAPGVAVQLLYDQAITGDPLIPPIVAEAAQRWYGFGAQVHNQHDLLKGLGLWGGNAARAAVWLLGVPAVWAALWPARRRLWPALLFVGAWWLAWLPYSLAGVADMGPVYLFAVAPLLAAALSVGFTQAPRWGRLGAAAAAAGALTFTPLVLAQGAAITARVAAPYAEVEAAAQGQRALALVRRRFPAETGWVFGLRPPDPRGTDAVVFAWATPQDRQGPPALRALVGWLGRPAVLHLEFTADGQVKGR